MNCSRHICSTNDCTNLRKSDSSRYCEDCFYERYENLNSNEPAPPAYSPTSENL